MKVLILSLLFFSSVCFSKESRRQIAVLDTGINRAMSKQPYMCANGVKFDIGYSGYDTHGHGSNIIGIIAKKIDVKKYCIVSIKVFHHYFRKGHEFWKYNITGGLNRAINLKVKYINMSLGGPEKDPLERQAIIKALRRKIKVIVAAGNKNVNLDKNCNYFPACYKLPEVKVVGNGHSNSSKDKSSNYGRYVVTDWRNGNRIYAGGSQLSGTSQAAAILTGELVKKDFTKKVNRSTIDRGDNNDFIRQQISDLFRRRRYDYSVVEKYPSRRDYRDSKRRRSKNRDLSSPSKAHRKFKTTQNKRSFNRGMERWRRKLGETCSCRLKTRRACRPHNE